MTAPTLTHAIIGAAGRMGHALIAAAPTEAPGDRLIALDRGDDLAAGIAAADVVIDFSTAEISAEVVRLARTVGKPLVMGTTGHTATEKATLLAELATLPVVWSGNYSVGVNLLFALTQRAAEVLDAEYDAEIIEMHHRFKRDAPSGTAARLLEIVLAARALPATAVRHGREGLTGVRSAREVGMHSLRGGDVVGDHTVVFATLGERLELTHKASDRAIFARGALRAARWLVQQPAGLYDMQDVLGLR